MKDAPLRYRSRNANHTSFPCRAAQGRSALPARTYTWVGIQHGKVVSVARLTRSLKSSQQRGSAWLGDKPPFSS